MISKTKITQISRLKLKKHRDIKGKFITEGKRLVLDGLKSNFLCVQIIISEEFCEKEPKLLKFLQDKFENVEIISDKDFNKISSTKTPQGIVAIFEIPLPKVSSNDEDLIICLENISDPGNVGAILRSCDWFGVKLVLLGSDCADLYNPKVIRASMGAIFTLHIEENVSLIQRIKELKSQNYKTYFADMSGIDYRKVNQNEKKVVTFCNEAFGPSEELKNNNDGAITIPKKGSIDSLNVAAAAAVIISGIT